MTIKLVTDEKIAETSSKGYQEKWYDNAFCLITAIDRAEYYDKIK